MCDWVGPARVWGYGVGGVWILQVWAGLILGITVWHLLCLPENLEGGRPSFFVSCFVGVSVRRLCPGGVVGSVLIGFLIAGPSHAGSPSQIASPAHGGVCSEGLFGILLGDAARGLALSLTWDS